MADSTDLTAWLRAQLDVDEQIATEAIQATTGRWTARETDWGGGTVVEDERGAMILPTLRTGDMQYQHIAAHDPARVLRGIEARRAIIARITNHATLMGQDNVHDDVLRQLAAEYADRPGYREEWRP